MSRAPKLSICPGCNTPRLRGEYHTRKDNTPQPLCVYCKKGRVYDSTAKQRTCQCCGETKRLKTEFTWLKNAGEYAVECRVCRAKVRDAEKAVRDEAEAQRKAKWAEKQCIKHAQEVCAEPVRTVRHSWENLGLEWSGRKVYDPYACANRYQGSRT